MKNKISQYGFVLLLWALLWSKTAFAADPLIVENLKATAGNGSVALSWDRTLDATGQDVKNYKIFYDIKPVASAEETYTYSISTLDNKTTYTLANLTNGVTYYFSVIAIAQNGLESSEYSFEASAVPTNFSSASGSVSSTASGSSLHQSASESWPQIEKAEAIDNQHIKITFNEGVILPIANPETAFTITPYDNKTVYLKINKAEMDSTDIALKNVLLTTDKQNAAQNYIITTGVNLTNLAGNPVVSGVYDTGFFIGSAIEPSASSKNNPTPPAASTSPATSTPPADTTPPEDINDLSITQKLLELNAYLITLTWTPSVNSAGDLIDQILYQSLNHGVSYGAGTSLGATTTKYETTLEGGKEYTFKITMKDNAGNESIGVIQSIRLPQTGPEMCLLISTMLSGMGVAFAFRRKK